MRPSQFHIDFDIRMRSSAVWIELKINLERGKRNRNSGMAAFNSNLNRLKIFANEWLLYFPEDVPNSFKGNVLKTIPIVLALSTFQPSVSDSKYAVATKL